MVRRALLYIRRKKSRSIILLLLMIVLAISISIGLSVWSGLNHAIHEVQKTLGTSFIVKMPDNMTVGPFEMIELIVFAKGARTVHQYKTLRLASRSGSWSGFSETWTPINRLAPVGMAANIYYEDGSMATYTLGYDGFMGDVAEGLITNGGH